MAVLYLKKYINDLNWQHKSSVTLFGWFRKPTNSSAVWTKFRLTFCNHFEVSSSTSHSAGFLTPTPSPSLVPACSQPRVPVRRIVGLPEEEEALATERSSGNIRDAVSPVAEMFRPVGLLLHSQSVPSFDNYGNGSAPPPPEAPTINEEKEEEGDELSNLPPKPPPRKNLLPGPSGELKKRE